MLSYNAFRTGLTFADVRRMLKIEANAKYNKGEYMFITRHTVLGRWREIKLKMYDIYLKEHGIKQKEIMFNEENLY